MTDKQQETISAYESNGWTIVTGKMKYGIIVMQITDVAPDGKETDLTAYIDKNGSSRIV